MPLLRILAIISFFFLSAQVSHAACISSSPGGSGLLEVFSKPVENGPVIGGVSVGQCNIEVSDQCSGNFCQIFLGTLSGWVDMQHIKVAADEPTVTQFVYQITGGNGTVTMLGRTQPTPVDAGGKVIFKPQGENMVLILPPESGMPTITMERIGSASFSGSMPDWGGFPVKVEVIAERVSDPRATLEFFTDSPQVKMDMLMNLTRTNKPRLSTKSSGASQNSNGQTQANSNQSQPGGGPMCLLVEDVAASIGIQPFPDLDSLYDDITDRVQLDLFTATEAQCQAILDAALNEGLLCEIVNRVGLPPNFRWGPVQINANGGTVKPIPAQFCRFSQRSQGGGSATGQSGTQNIKNAEPTPPRDQTGGAGGTGLCDALSLAIGPILRGDNASGERSGLMSILKSVGVFDIAQASTGECRQITIDLQKAGLIAEGAIDLTAPAADGFGGPETQGGEDPRTMIEGGVEIPGNEADFAPADQGSGTSAASNGQAGEELRSRPVACITLADHVLKILNGNSLGDIAKLQSALKAASISNISSRTTEECLIGINEMLKADLI